MFRDRADAGEQLAQRLMTYRDQQPVVIGLPRGGVPVAAKVASALHAPLDVIVVRKVGVPGHEELGLGAVTEEDIAVFNDDIVRQLRLPPAKMEAALDKERATLATRLSRIRAVHPPVSLMGRLVIIVDDGIATGIDARAACRVARARGARFVIVATPVAPDSWAASLAGEAEAFVALEEDPLFAAVGAYYEDFGQVSDEEALACLAVGPGA